MKTKFLFFLTTAVALSLIAIYFPFVALGMVLGPVLGNTADAVNKNKLFNYLDDKYVKAKQAKAAKKD